MKTQRAHRPGTRAYCRPLKAAHPPFVFDMFYGILQVLRVHGSKRVADVCSTPFTPQSAVQPRDTVYEVTARGD